jgi:Kelch motif
MRSRRFLLILLVLLCAGAAGALVYKLHERENRPRIDWTDGPAAPLGRVEAHVVQVGSSLFVLGGFADDPTSLLPVTDRCDVFDLEAGRWTPLAPLPAGAARTHGGVASDGKFIYLVAGQPGPGYGEGTSASFRYDIARNAWDTFVDLPEVRFGGGLVHHNGSLHYFGGNTADRATVTTDHWTLELANPNAGWSRKAPMPQGGDHLGHAVVNGRIYAIGGEHGHHPVSRTGTKSTAPYVQHDWLFSYDPAADRWSQHASLPVATSHFEGGTVVVNNKILLIGGILTGGENHITNAIRFYDPANDRWTTLKDKAPFPLMGCVAGYWKGRVYLTNGYGPAAKITTRGWWGTVGRI